MKRKEKQQFASMTKEELAGQLGEVRKVIGELNINKFTKPVKNVRLVRALRRKGAVIQTKMQEFQLKNTKEQKHV